MSRTFDAWSFLRDVLQRGAAIERDCEAKGLGHEQLSARLDAAAREWAGKLKPHLADRTPAERVEDALVVILSSWDRWGADAAQQAQQDQDPDSYTDTMHGYLRPVLEGLL